MRFDVNTPPKLTGKYSRDIPAIHIWCSILHRKLKGMFGRIDNEQISSVSAEKITGNINLESCRVRGGTVNISSDYFFVGNDTNYIKFENGVLEVKTS